MNNNTNTYTDTRPDVHEIETLPTIVMNAFEDGAITRDEVEQNIAKYEAYSKISTSQEYTDRWGKTATELEHALQEAQE